MSIRCACSSFGQRFGNETEKPKYFVQLSTCNTPHYTYITPEMTSVDTSTIQMLDDIIKHVQWEQRDDMEHNYQFVGNVIIKKNCRSL